MVISELREDFNAHINTTCNDTQKSYEMKIVTHAPAQRPTRRSARRRSNRNATVDDQIDVITFCALTRRRTVSALWQVFLQKQLEVREGKERVLAMWIRNVSTHDLRRRAPFIDVVAPGCARVLMSARSRSSHVLAISSSFKHTLYSSPAGAFTEHITRAHIGSVLPARTVAQRFGRDLLVVVLHLLSIPSCGREVGASWTDVAVTLVAGLVVPRPRWLVWLPVRCLWGRWHVWWHSWVVTAACTSTCA